MTLDLLFKLGKIDRVQLLVVRPDRLIFNHLIWQSFAEQVTTLAHGDDRAVAIGATSDQHVVRAPCKVIDRRIMNVADNGDWCLLVGRVNYDLIGRCDCEDHSVREFQECGVLALCRLLVQVWVELDASCVCLEAW